MRQTCKKTKMTFEIDEQNNRIENLQNAIIDLKREIFNILYDKMLDIFEIVKRKNVDDLYNKMIDFSNHLLKIMRLDFANVCC